MNIPLKLLRFLFVLATTATVFSQENREVLLTINDEAITVGEFKSVYLKNLNLVQEDSQKDVAGYLELFIDYKLKIQEAYRQNLDEKESYQRELKGYRKQLVKNHLTDIAVTDKLVKEAYNRMKEEVKARHILVRIDEAGSAADTLNAYHKIVEARKEILAGADFNTVAKKYSDDPSAAQNDGELGWFKAFKMVYPFEAAAYETKTGEVSAPFRTRFGYHIVQPTARRVSAGEVSAAHIMIALKQKDSTLDPEKRIREIYRLLQQGESFENLAIKYSDDKKSGKSGGVINKFSKGQLSSRVFEDTVFAIEKEGVYTAPFKTDFGWHIAKLIKRYPVGDYAQMKYELENRVKRDARARIISDSLSEKLFKLYDIQIQDELLRFFQEIVTKEINTETWTFDRTLPGLDKIALALPEVSYTYADVGDYLERAQKLSKKYPSTDAYVADKLDYFFEKRVTEYHEEHLEEIDTEFAAVLKEYQEGLLLFDLMETTIWNKAKTDTLGLQSYFDANRASYKWDERIDVSILNATDKKNARTAQKMLALGKTEAEIIKELNTGDKVNILATRKTLPVSDTSLPEDLVIKKGTSAVYNAADFTVYQIHEVLPAGLKTLEEARGQVATDFQKEAEAQWVASLRKKAKIKVEKKMLTALSKSLQAQ